MPSGPTPALQETKYQTAKLENRLLPDITNC